MNQITEQFLEVWTKYGLNASLGVLGVLIIVFFIVNLEERNKRAALFRIREKTESRKEDNETKKKNKKNPFVLLEEKIQLAFFFNRNEKREQIVYYTILGIELITIVAFIATSKYLLAVLLPIIFHYLTMQAIDLWTRNIHDYIQETLPTAIRHFIKVMTKTSDLRIVTYEAGKSIEDPLRSEFLDASRRMSTESPEQVLMDLADRLQNSWVHSFVFILSSQKESSRKEDVIKNLALLAEIIDTENRIAERAVAERKGLVVLNWVLVVASLSGFAANLIWVNSSYEFFFESAGGMFAMLFGFIAVCVTIIINIILSKKVI